MDGDVFGKVGRLGCHAADALHRALGGGRWEPFHASKCLDAVITRAGGVPLLAVVRGELQTLRALPLLARASVEGAIQRIRDAALGPECTRLDLILRSVTERALLGSEFRMRPVLEQFCGEVLDGAVVTGRVEVQAYFASARPSIKQSRPQARKERERDLFSAAG